MRLLSFLLLTLTAFAGQPYSLCDGSFNNWEGDTKTTWRIEEGAFTAGSVEKNQPRNEFLSTKKEFGDFDLSVKWKLAGTKGFVNGGVQFRTKRIPDHHEVSGYQADLGAGMDGALYDESRRNKMLAKPAKDVLEKAKKPLGEWNTYRIRAEGPRIQLWLNGVQTVDFTETEKDIPRTGIIAVQIHGDAKSQVWYKDIVIEELGEKKEAPKPAELKPLSDGSFTGWDGDTQTTWRISEGAFTAGSLERTQPRNEYLTSKTEYDNFELSAKWRITGDEATANGGVMFRVRRVAGSHEVAGYQADFGQIYDGALYDENRRNRVLAKPAADVLAKARTPRGEWNDYRIRAEGRRIQLWLNGVQTVDWTEPDANVPQRGFISLQMHGGGKFQLAYKDIIITELPPSGPAELTGPTARFADPQPAPPREPFKDGKFEIRPGEVIVFTGGTNMVRLIEQGWFEASLALAAQEQKPRFRSMAWDGDTVYEQWRDMNFGSWKEQLDAVSATCVFLWFGQMEALDDSRDDAAFEQAAAKLLDEFKAVTPRLVVITPMEFDIGNSLDPTKPITGLPDNRLKNGRILRLGRIMKKLAQQRGSILLDWPALEKAFPAEDDVRRTSNGVHLQGEAIRYAYGAMLKKGLNLLSDEPVDPLLAPTKAKNRLWHDCWKAMNWAFAYSDRTEQPFGKGIGDHPPMAKELEKYKPLLREADHDIHEIALRHLAPLHPIRETAVLTPPQSPDEERATFKVREGFDVNLFASEADGLVKPLSMRWDHKGRLWAACSPSYPQLVPGEPHSDYILVCDDTDADGKADKFHKFADDLTMPMGIEFGDGGVYVCESTQLAFFKDTDGDGKANERTVILSGFGTGDSHQMINSLRWGPDGCLWFSQGLHIFSRIETPHGIVRFDRAGIWRFDPRTWKLQGFFGNAAAGANCWGVTFDDWGQVFHCAADNNPGFYTTPGLGTWPNPPPYYNIGSLAVSPVKGMCMEFINSTHLPPDLQGVLCKPVYFANQLLLYKLVEDGSGYKTEDLGPLLTSSSNAFRPLGVQTGPDGALYICDWYNPVIGHYQASYRDPNRDKIHGRIWRVSAKGRPPVKRPELEKMDPAQLVEQLRSPERWVRDQARRLLTFVPEDLWKAPKASPAFLYEALSVHAGQGEVTWPLLSKCLTHEDARVRAFAVRVWSQQAKWPEEGTGSPDDEEYIIKLLANAVNDRHLRVRLEAVIAAGYFKNATALELACGVLDHPRDRFIDYALANTVHALKPYWSNPLEEGRLTFEGNTAHLAFVLQTDGGQQMGPVLRKLLEGGKVAEENRASLRALLVGAGGPDDLTYAASAGPISKGVAEALLAAMRDRGVKPAGEMRAALDKWFAEIAEQNGVIFQPLICRLAAVWGYPDIAAKLLPMTTAGPEEQAVNAVRAWAEVKGRDSLPDLERLAQDQRRAVAAAAAGQLLRFDAAKGAASAVRHFAAAIGPDTATSLLSDVLAVQSGPEQLATAFAKQPPPSEMALTLLKALSTAGRSDATLASVLRKAAGLPENASVVPDYNADFVAKLIADVRATGDAKRGEAVFMAAQSACIGCHKVGDTGGITGPDLTAIGRGMTPELITESVLWPKRQIKEGFFLTTVTTHDGKVLSGYKVNEDAKSLALRSPGAAVTDTVAKDKVKDRSDTGTLMPENLTGWMTEEQRRDLLRYLFELGK